MLARILYIPDLHKRYKDSSSIKGQIEVQNLIQEDIISFVERNGITHLIIGGDWYDRGFHGLGPAFGAIEMDRRISKAVNGNVYLCVGNHFYLERDENPEMYIIQPNAYFKPQTDMPMPDEPIFQCVNDLRIGNVQISFFHFNRINKSYVNDRQPGVTYHVGIYHDDACVPGWVREFEGYRSTTTSLYMNDIYRNIDIAIHGHIHHKTGLVKYDMFDGRTLPMFIPGSLGITQNKDILKHTEIQTPVIEIDDDSNVSLKLATFSTHIDKLKFYTTKKKNPVSLEQVSNQKILVSSKAIQSLPAYLQSKGYSNTDLKLVDAASKGILNLATAVAIISEVDNG